MQNWNHPFQLILLRPTMAAIFTSPHFTALVFCLVFFHKTLASHPTSSFSFTDFEKDPQFKSSVALYGNAKIVNFSDGSAIQLSGTGRVMYENPIKLVEGKSRKVVSFSTYFTFSMSLEEEDVDLAFVMAFGNDSFSGVSFSSGLTNRNFLGVSFEVSTSRDGNGRNGSSVIAKIINSTSSVKIGLKSEQKLHVWIDYEASSTRLEVRLSQYGNLRPFHPLLWHKTNLSKEKNSMFMGFSTLKNTSETCFLHSWSFTSRQFPYSLHSEPVNPNALNNKSENLRVTPKCDCFFRAVSAMVFGAGFGGLMAFIVLSFWSMLRNRRRPVAPEECVDEEFKNKKVNIVVDNKSGMKK